MQREKEFTDFLEKKDRTRRGEPNSPSSIENYLTYCRNIEKAYDNKLDMDDIVARNYDFDSILLKLIDYRKRKKKTIMISSLEQHKYGLERYQRFVAACSVPSVACGGDAETAHVKYESSVFPSERPAGLCQFIEDVYPDVIAYAENLLGSVPLKGVRPIPVFLSKEEPQETYLPDVDALTKKICRNCEYFCEGCNGRDPRKCKNCRECDMRGRYGTIREILCANEPITSDIAGRFFADPEPHIVLYFRQFDTATFWESAANVLAHEYLHYLHYSYAHSAINDYHKHKELSEALADFFCVQYSLHRGDNDIAQRKYNAWQRRQNTTWPYWWALRFLPQPYRRHITDYTEHDWIQKYLWVFKESTDSDRAFQRLKED